MLRTRLLTATAAVALFAAGSTFAQTAPAETLPMQPAPAEAAPTAQTPAAENSVIDVLRANGQFTTLLGALDAAQLTDTLETQPAISIFAPTDAAFAALPEADRDRLLDPANVNELRQVLLYHVVVADVEASQIEGTRGGVQTAADTEVQLDGTGGVIKVDNATVTTADLDAGNGAVFIIDRVLNPAESLVASGDGEAAAVPLEDEAAAAPADEAVDEVTPPVADNATSDTMDADSATDEAAVPPPPTTPSAEATAAPTAPTTAPTTATAPDGQPAASTTVIASPPVVNPTDGQIDGEEPDDDSPQA